MITYILIFFTLLVVFGLWNAKRGAFAGGQLSGADLNHVQDLFFRTVFTLLGYVAKRDGPINQKEIKRTETYMEKMDLDAKQKREAIRLFKVGAEPQFSADKIINEFHGLAKKSPNLAQILLVYLINLARVDGLLVNKEVEAVQKIATGLGYSNIMFKHLLQMVTSQNKFGDIKNQAGANKDKNDDKNSARQAEQKNSQTVNTSKNSNVETDDESCSEKTENFQHRPDQLSAAYDVFDLPMNASDAEVKKAYRTLVNQYHPDKLMGQGLPPYMIQSATECFQTIQAAYDYIKEARAK